MASDSINVSATFYSSSIGKVNARIMGNSCASIDIEMLEKYGASESILFMGLGDGLLLERIAPRFKKVTVVEASDLLVNEARQRFAGFSGLTFINSYFEAYQIKPEDRVSCILGNHILEHVDDPVEVLRISREWLAPGGLAVFTVPNATSLHRRIGVELGMLSQTSSASGQDGVIGHQRVYDIEGLCEDVRKAGYEIIEMGGFNVKLVSQAQMADWSDALHRAIFTVSRKCPVDICSNLYVASRRL